MTEVERAVVRAARGRLVFVVAVGLLALATLALFLRGESTRKIVQRAPCIEAPAGKACQKSKRHSDRRRSIADTCISFWKVGYDCPAPDSGVSIPARGGDSSQPAPPAGQPSSPAKPPAHHDSDKPKRPPRDTGKPAGGGNTTPPPPTESPAPPAAPEPGDSGSGASSEHGLDTCVELAVSACVHVDAGTP